MPIQKEKSFQGVIYPCKHGKVLASFSPIIAHGAPSPFGRSCIDKKSMQDRGLLNYFQALEAG